MRMSVLKLKPASHLATVSVAASSEISVPVLKKPFPMTPEKLIRGLFVKLMPAVYPK